MHHDYTTLPIKSHGHRRLYNHLSGLWLLLSAIGLILPGVTAKAQNNTSTPCVVIESVSWENVSDCGQRDGALTFILTDASNDGSTYSLSYNSGGKERQISGLTAREGILTVTSLYPGDYNELTITREVDGCASEPYPRTILIDHACELNNSRGVCGSSNFNYTNCAGDTFVFDYDNIEPNTWIYTDDNGYCGIAYVDGCAVQPSFRAHCLDFTKIAPTPYAGVPFGQGRFNRVIGYQNAGYTDELAMERINWVLCNADTTTQTALNRLYDAIWYFTGTKSTTNSVTAAAIANVPSIQGGIANQMIFFIPINPDWQPFVRGVCFDTCKPDVTINNTGDCTLEVFVVDSGETSYGALTSGNSLTLSLFENTVLNIRTLDGTLIQSYTVTGCADQSINVASNNCHDACNGNVLINPGFENGTTGWSTNGSNVTTTTTAVDVYTGTTALKLGSANSGASQSFTLSALQTYELTFWAKEHGSTGSYQVGIDYLNASGAEIAEEVLTISGNAYQEYTITGLAPLFTASANVWIYRNGSTNGSAYFDEFCLTLGGVATPTASVSDWNFDCDSDATVDVIPVGANCQTITTVTIPNSGNVYQYVVEIVYKGGNPGSTITFTDASGNNYGMNRTTPIGSSTSVKVYRGLVDGSTSSITYTDLLKSCQLQSIIVYPFRSTGGSSTISSGTFTTFSGYRSSESFTISIPNDFTSRDITVNVPVSEMTNDCRLLYITAEAGGVSETVTIYESDASLGTCCLAIPSVTLHDVPATATSITVTVTSPSGSSNSCPVSADQNGQSFVVAGFVTVEVECGDCDIVSAGTLTGEEEACGGYDPSQITGNDVINGVPACPAAGSILLERYDDISGGGVSDLTSSSKYPNSPDYTTTLTSLFESPTNIGDNYGTRLSGYICPPQSGNYIFWIASDDGGELNLSTDSSPGNATTIATVPGWASPGEWNKYAAQQSSSIYLEAGEVYYIEALMKEAAGGDNLAVGWQLPDGTLERPIPASYLSAPSDGIVATYQWQYRLGTSGTWIDISGATGANYDPGPITQTTQYRRGVMTDACGSVYSNEVTKRVVNSPEATLEAQNGDCLGNTGAIVLTFSDNLGYSGIEFSLDGVDYPYSVNDDAGTYTINDLNSGEYTVWARWDSGECPVELGTVTVGFDDSGCDDDFSTPFFNDCGEGRIIDVQVAGLINSSDNCITVGNTSGMTRLIVEVWIEESDCPGSTFPNYITITDGSTSKNIAGISVVQVSGSTVAERIYRAEFTGTVSQVCISEIGGCAASSAALYIERTSTDGSSAFQPVDHELYGSSATDCITTGLQIGASDVARDVTISVPIHEKDNTREVAITVNIKNASNAVVSTATQTFTSQTAGDEAALYTMTLPDVPGDGINVEVEVCSPNPNGDSFGVGAIATSSTDGCVECSLELICESYTPATGWVTEDDCTVEVCEGTSLALSVNPNGLTYQWEGPNGLPVQIRIHQSTHWWRAPIR
ncbi:MAG: PA14 domain-containing protein [Saprospiraceae bacterium]